jgi:hypothetical protein
MLVFLDMMAGFSRRCAGGTIGPSILKTHPHTDSLIESRQR